MAVRLLCSSKNFMLLVVCVVVLISPIHSADEERKVYIVYMGNVDETNQSHSTHHLDMLQKVVDRRFSKQSLVRSYTRSFNGFAAYLTPQELQILASDEKVVSIFPSITYKLMTTRSWDFMGLTENANRNPTIESDTIIGVIDSGIWPESESFNDKGFSPPPKKWKGACNGGQNFTCNNKLIGARNYNSGEPSSDGSVRDEIGHGTHTASTAAGNYVKGASFHEIAKGTARGGVPSARIAAYRVCQKSKCSSEDIMGAFDDAIADGVDVITISIGTESPDELNDSVIAIGSLHAFAKGILVVQSAGNTGQKRSTSSVAPWIFSVAASSSDRAIITKVALGNGTLFSGKAVNPFTSPGKGVPVVNGMDASSGCDEILAENCLCLSRSLAEGKIVLCNTNLIAKTAAATAGAVGVIVALDPTKLINFSQEVSLPASRLSEHDYKAVLSYVNSTISPKLDILKSESVRNVEAPLIAIFSSRGPNAILPDILKPDITAPGVEILAAYPTRDNSSAGYHVLSGTSMSCPHVAGAAAYVKSFHPDWSPSAIKSALMTTAWRMDPAKDSLAEFSYGAGHIDPVKAVEPGLVYETSVDDYVKMLCGVGYDAVKLKNMFGSNVTCPVGQQILPKDLNYPSMTSQVLLSSHGNESVAFSKTFQRTVTNVGVGKSSYTVTTSTSSSYNITVKPGVLRFQGVGQKRSFEVIISGEVSNRKMVSASLEWSDGVHKVRSPIVVYADNL